MYARTFGLLSLAGLAAGASPALAQYAVSPRAAASAIEMLDSMQGGKLDCQIRHTHPFLDFSFRFEAGYVVRCPIRLFGGDPSTILTYIRVTPAGGKPLLLAEQYRFPGIPADMRDKVKISHLSESFELSGGFTLGEGEYAIELVLVDNQDRVARNTWKVKASRNHSERHVEVAIPPNTAGAMAGRPWDGSLAPAGQGLRVTVLLDAAPMNPASLALRAWDRAFLLDSVSSLLRQIPCESIRLVAFNLDQQREIFRDDRFSRSAFSRLARSLRRIELGTVSYNVLKRQFGWAELLAKLTNEESTAAVPSDIVVFLGPSTRISERVPEQFLQSSNQNNPRWFYFEYYPNWRRGSEFPDTIDHLTNSHSGTIIRIHSPGELAKGIQRMLSQVHPPVVSSTH